MTILLVWVHFLVAIAWIGGILFLSFVIAPTVAICIELEVYEGWARRKRRPGMEVRSKTYTYRTTVNWTERKMGEISSAGKPTLQVAAPPEFKGHEGIWSPEDLFVASVNVCVMSTFLAFAERAGLGFTGYESEAEGRLEMVDGKFQVTTITLKPRLTLKPGEDAGKDRELLAKAESNCLMK